MKQITLFETEDKSTILDKSINELPYGRIKDENFDFKEIPASTGIYGIHPYPAMFHFFVVRKLIEEYSKKMYGYSTHLWDLRWSQENV